jgi:MOSC domain-containing protein YiiM
MSGTILFVCTSEKKGVVKRATERAIAVAGHGIQGDAHAGGWHRQVSLLADEDIETVRRSGLKLAPGAFAENLVVEGIDLTALGIGSRLRVGSVELEITQIGKECHHPCAIQYLTGQCIMPRAGIFTRVLQGGELRSGLEVEVLEAVPPEGKGLADGEPARPAHLPLATSQLRTQSSGRSS